jgi:hypothetical protein
MITGLGLLWQRLHLHLLLLLLASVLKVEAWQWEGSASHGTCGSGLVVPRYHCRYCCLVSWDTHPYFAAVLLQQSSNVLGREI